MNTQALLVEVSALSILRNRVLSCALRVFRYSWACAKETLRPYRSD